MKYHSITQDLSTIAYGNRTDDEKVKNMKHELFDIYKVFIKKDITENNKTQYLPKICIELSLFLLLD